MTRRSDVPATHEGHANEHRDHYGLYWTGPEIRERYDITPPTMTKWIKEGYPAIKIGIGYRTYFERWANRIEAWDHAHGLSHFWETPEDEAA